MYDVIFDEIAIKELNKLPEDIRVEFLIRF